MNQLGVKISRDNVKFLKLTGEEDTIELEMLKWLHIQVEDYYLKKDKNL